MGKYREQIALAAAAVLTAISFFSISSWSGALLDVCHHAAIFAVLTIALFAATRKLGPRGVAVERTWSALFLAGMPIVYILAWVTSGGGGTRTPRLVVELCGFLIYGAAAWLGFRRWPWLLPAGIAAHGIGWDAGHHAVGSAYVPTWYVTGCLLVDLGIGVYLAVRMPVWRAYEGRAAPGSALLDDGRSQREVQPFGVHLLYLPFIAVAEASYGERMDYLRHMVRFSRGAFLKFVRLTSVSRYRRFLPAGPFHVVRILTARHEDCGACVQTTVNMAKADRRPTAELRAVVEGRPDDLPEELADIYRFVDKVLRATHDEGELREKIRAPYQPRGDAVLSEIALVLCSTRAFPITKRLLGYATSCGKVAF